MKKNRYKSDESKMFEKIKAKIMMTRGRKEKQEKLRNFHLFMKKYIAYARQNVFPKFDKYLEEEYLPEKFAGLDHEHKSSNTHERTFPITPRHIWIIRRIAEARRRIFLEEQCTTEDVDYAIKKIEGSLEDIAIDKETGKIDADWVEDGVSSKRKKMIEIFDDVCSELEDEKGNISVEEFYKKMDEMGFRSYEIEEYIEKKKTHGDIIFPRNGVMRRL